MGLFEELIILVKETIEEVNERQRKKQGEQQKQEAPSQPTVASGNQDDELARVRERLARRAAQQQAERAAAMARVEAEAAAARPLPQLQPKPITKPLKPILQQQGGHHRLAKLLHRPGTLRELVLLREILDKPLALRQRR